MSSVFLHTHVAASGSQHSGIFRVSLIAALTTRADLSSRIGGEALRGQRGRHAATTRAATGSSNGSGAELPDAAVNDANGRSMNGNHRHRQRRSHKQDDALPLSLFTPYHNLPTEGRTQHEGDESCNPMERSCQTPMYVWESNCIMCGGSGSVTSYSSRRRGGRRMTYVCPGCHGIGCVRKTSSRILPDVNGGNGQYTAGRPRAIQTEEDKKKSLLERMQEKLRGVT